MTVSPADSCGVWCFVTPSAGGVTTRIARNSLIWCKHSAGQAQGGNSKILPHTQVTQVSQRPVSKVQSISEFEKPRNESGPIQQISSCKNKPWINLASNRGSILRRLRRTVEEENEVLVKANKEVEDGNQWALPVLGHFNRVFLFYFYKSIRFYKPSMPNVLVILYNVM